MKLMNKMVLGGLFALAMAASTGTASADPGKGLLIDTAALAPNASLSLKSDIASAKTKNIAAFKQVNDIAMHAEELDKQSRRPGMPLTNQFKALGADGLMPMLEMLAFEGKLPANAPPTARAALENGLIEAVGLLKDKKALPVLSTILTKSKDATTTFTTADAIAKLGSDEAIATLTTALKGADAARSKEILRGFGSAHRLSAVQTLATNLDAHPDAATAAVLAKTIGRSANAWAWKALQGGAEETPSREAAARSLMRAFVSYEGDTRNEAMKALLVVDSAITTKLINEARKGASPELSAALDDLSSRYAANPSR